MTQARHITYCIALAWQALAISVAGSLFAAANADDMYDYMSIADELDRIGPDFARTHGKKALIDEYRLLIDAYPGFANNMQMETQIAFIHEWDLTESGQPPNPTAAFETLTHVINTYPFDHPYMKTVRQLAANRAIAVDPKVAKDMYTSLMEDYPEDNVLAAESLFSLGQIAERQGDAAEADRYYTQTIKFKPTGGENSSTESEEVEAHQANAAAVMLGAAIRRYDDPKERLRALDEFLREHAEFAEQFGDLTQRLRATIEDQVRQQTEAVAGTLTTATAPSQTVAVYDPSHPTSRDAATAAKQRAEDSESPDSLRTASAAGLMPANAASGNDKSATRRNIERAAQMLASSPAARVVIPACLAIAVLGVVIFVRRRFT